MRFVFPIPDWLRGSLLFECRLYAYPTVPESNMSIKNEWEEFFRYMNTLNRYSA